MKAKRSKKSTIIESLFNAQRIAFAPFIFQATVVAKKRGVLSALGQAPLTYSELSEKTGLSLYALKILCEVLLASDVIAEDNGRFSLTGTGQCLTYDTMSGINLNFTNDVCYRGLSHLEESLDNSKPAGLAELGPWQTIYQALSSLPQPAKQSWFEFDHFYSGRTFAEAIDYIESHLHPKHILDIGGNTGKFAKAVLERLPQATLTIVDLPQQCALAQANPMLETVKSRLYTACVNWLDPEASPAFEETPQQADLFWMSQFLDCFSPEEAISILVRLKPFLAPHGHVCILESLWDEQHYRAAALSLVCTSMYFTAMANGNSRFFSGQELREIIARAGYVIESEVPNLGVGSTLLVCKVAP